MAMKTFLISLKETLNASGVATLSYQIPKNQILHVNSFAVKSQGAFDITMIRDSAGNQYTNASSNNGIDSDMLKNVDDGNNHIAMFEEPIVITGGNSIYIELLDTSAASNEVQFILECSRDYQGG